MDGILTLKEEQKKGTEDFSGHDCFTSLQFETFHLASRVIAYAEIRNASL